MQYQQNAGLKYFGIRSIIGQCSTVKLKRLNSEPSVVAFRCKAGPLRPRRALPYRMRDRGIW